MNLESATFKGVGTVADVSAERRFKASGLGSFIAGWFDLGYVEWTSGANAGRKSEVSRHSLSSGAGIFELFEAPVRSIAIGDGFVIRAGCDKQFRTCKAKFSNAVNFRGFPHMPGDDTIIRYPNKGDANSGDPL